MTFDSETLSRLREKSWLRMIIHREVVGSTNDFALRRADDTAVDVPLLIIADRQTMGRGRGANRWWSPTGALLFSILLDATTLRPATETLQWTTLPGVSRPSNLDLGQTDAVGSSESVPAPIPALHLPVSSISLVTGLAVCAALQQLVPGLAIGIKWPNDILVNERKLAGILVEIPRHRPDRIVVGIGLNVNNGVDDAPPELAERAISLSDAARHTFSLPDVLNRVVSQLGEHLQQFAHDKSQLVPRWQALCVLTGKQVRLLIGKRCVEGRCHGIDADGALIVQTSTGRQYCNSGIVTQYED